jgi:hypothetical protein
MCARGGDVSVERTSRAAWLLYPSFAVLLVVAGSCTESTPAAPVAPPPATPAGAWFAHLQQVPYPYSIPIPSPKPSVIDGAYAKVEPEQAGHVPCKRCPDYAAGGGIWKLHLGDGVFHVYHEPTGWRSLGSFTTFYDQNSAERIDQLVLFNDPHCPGVVGLYNWRLAAGELVLEVVGDTCSMGLRAANLASRPWASCRPPNVEAGASDHWPKPPGCD